MIELHDLPYPYDALNPVISEQALRIHHLKHHAGYVARVNTLLEQDVALENGIQHATATGNEMLLNNAGQAWNHWFFWQSMTPQQTEPRSTLMEAINAAFGDMAGLRSVFVAEGVAHFGSGWIWLTIDADGLSVNTTHDGDTVILGGEAPLLVCDLWEHAYYLDHMNDRAAYLSAWWDRLVNWDFAQLEFEAYRLGLPPLRYGEPAFDDVSAITDPEGFEHALAEVATCLDWPPQAGSSRERRFRRLLLNIDAYEASNPHALRQAASGSLDRRLRDAASAIERRRQNRLSSWNSLVGGNLRP